MSSPSSADELVARLGQAVAVMGALADDTVRRFWPDLPDEVVDALEEIGRCRSAALADVPPAVPVAAAAPACEVPVDGAVVAAEGPR